MSLNHGVRITSLAVLALIFFFFSFFFLRTRNSIRGFVRPSVRWPIRPSVRWSIMLELKTRKTRIYDAAVVIECVCVCVNVWEGGWGMAGGWLSLPTRPQRYCDPASLVFFCVDLFFNIGISIANRHLRFCF